MPLIPQQQMPYYSTKGGATPTNIKIYIANLSDLDPGQAPTVESNGTGPNTPFKNTIGTITWERESTGLYKTAETFNITKTQVFITPSNRAFEVAQFYAGINENDNKVFISTQDLSMQQLADGVLLNTPIKIIVNP